MMEEVISCEICTLKFTENFGIPKVLYCGHSFCWTCVKKLLETNSCCPKCRTKLEAEYTADDYPTNFSLLAASEEYKSFKSVDSHLICSMKIMEKKLANKRETLITTKSLISSKLDLIENGLKRLQELNSQNEAMDYKKVKNVLEELEEVFKNIENVEPFDFWKLRLSVTLSLSCFKPDEYLLEIYQRLQNDEKIYGVGNIGNVAKYGKVSFLNNLILFRALALNEKPESTTLIWFDELKQCTIDSNMFTFLELSCNDKGIVQLLTIEMYDSQLASQFIKLCTGECGPCYKDCHYEKYEVEKDLNYQGIMRLEKRQENNLQNYGQINYSTKQTNRVEANKDDILIFGQANGGFIMVKSLNKISWTGLTGKVINPRNITNFISFSDASELKIVDCGILFKL